jgi:CBS domain-containing protein
MKHHTVNEIMTREVVSVRMTAGYKDIVETLAAHRLSAVPVVDEDRHVIGVVSEADLLPKMELAGTGTRPRLLMGKRERVARTKAAADTATNLMTFPAIVIGDDEPVSAAAKVMDAERIKRLPVVDEDQCLVGVVSRSDVLRLFLRDDAEIRQEVIDDVLLKTMWIDPTELTVTVERGVVTLDGVVERQSQIPVILQLVQTVAGVVETISHLTAEHDDIHHRLERPDVPFVA